MNDHFRGQDEISFIYPKRDKISFIFLEAWKVKLGGTNN